MQSQPNVNLLEVAINTFVRQIVAPALPWLVLLVPAIALAEVRISPAAADSETAALVATIRNELSNASPQIAALDARVTVGAAAFREALAQNDTQPLIAAYLSSVEFETALGTAGRPSHITAVFANPDPAYQVALARKLLGRSTIGVFDSPAAHSLVTRITGQGVRAIPVSPGQGIDSLLRAANSLDVILVMPDSAVLNRSNINHVVRTLYRQRKVLVGYSATLTRVGSLASVYVTPEATARSVARVLEQFSASGVLPGPIFVRDVDVSINDRLARSLSIALPDRAEMMEAVRSKAAEATP